MSFPKTLYIRRVADPADPNSYIELSGPTPQDVAEPGEITEAAVYRLVGMVSVTDRIAVQPKSMPLSEHRKTEGGLPVLEHVTDEEGDPMAAFKGE